MNASSSSLPRYARLISIAGLLTLLAALIPFAAPPSAVAQSVPRPPHPDLSNGWVWGPPPSPWVKANVVDSWCEDRGTEGVCSSRTTPDASGTLYENPRLGISVPQGGGTTNPSPPRIAVARPICVVSGQPQGHAGGRWHYGATFEIATETWYVYRVRGETDWSLNRPVGVPQQLIESQTRAFRRYRGPTDDHWAFGANGNCRLLYGRPTATPAGPPTATPPGFVPSPTPPGWEPPPTPTPDIPDLTPTPPPPCFEGAIPPMPLVLYEGQVPFDGSNINPPFNAHAGRYIGNDPEQYYDENPDNAYTYETPEDYYAMLPERNLWVRVNPNRIVQATFDLERTSFSRLDAPVKLFAFDINPLLARKREMVIVLQDLGNDRRPSGDDTLLAFLALADSDPDGIFGGRQVLRVRATRDTPPNNIDGRPGVGGQPAFQAVLHPSVNPGFTARIFSWAGNPGPDVPPLRWPAPLGALPGRDWLWPPGPGGDPNVWGPGSPLALRFATQPNRVYRMFAFTKAPMCDGYAGAVAQLVFHTLGDADMAIEKSAPAEAVREEQISYGLTARNIGTTAAQNVVVTDTLPEGVTFVSADPPPSRVDGRTLTWDLGAVDAGAARSIALTVNVLASAPDGLTNVGEVRADNDSNLANNRAEATTALVRTNVAVRMTATRMVRPGDEFTVTITYRNTSGTTARNARLTYNRPFGAALLSSSRAPSATEGAGMVWTLGDLGAGAEGTITLRMRALRENEAATLPAALAHVAVIAAAQDADPRDNEARAVTALLVMPQPNGALRMRIYSEFDRMQQVYRTNGTAFAWPIGETLYFLPEVTLQPPPIMTPPAYAARQRVVAWSFVGSGPLTLSGTGCKARETPPAAETEHADLSRMRGCVYRYRETAGPSDMLGQGRLYWAPFAPASLAEATYGVWPLPGSPTSLRIQYAVLTELVETGWYDLDGDGRDDSVLDRRTDILDGTFTVTLVAPRDVR